MKKKSKMILSLAVALAVLIGCVSAGSCMAKDKNTQINIKIGKKTLKATLYNNKTSKALLKKLPVSYKMSELNGNEKYKYLSYELPTNEKKVKKIKAGDIMLYGSDCLVVFYKSFKTNYKYTKIGHINNTKGLKKAVGKGSVKMKFKAVGNQTKSTKSPAATNTAVPSNVTTQTPDVTEQPSVTPENTPTTTENVSTTSESSTKEKQFILKIGDKKVNVAWEDNASVAALREMAVKNPVSINMSMYGGFEQVGALGTSLPRSDEQMTTSSGDIVLYSGNQIVVFYGSNSWSYTKLGHITDVDSTGMKELLGSGNVTITLGME